MSSRRGDEWPALVAGLLGAVVLFVAATVVWGVHAATTKELSQFERMRGCLESEKQLSVGPPPPRDAIARTAGLGALRTTVLGTSVTIVVAADDGDAQRIAQGYRAVGGSLGGRLQTNGRYVYFWDADVNPSQAELVLECQN